VTRRGYHFRGQPGSAQGKPALLDRQNPNWLPSRFVVAGSGGSLEIGSIGEKPKIAEVNLLRLTGSLIYRWRRDRGAPVRLSIPLGQGLRRRILQQQ
jgi:hypothetical protein